MTNAPQEKLSALRKHMSQFGVDFYFVPTRDDHNNEYVPAHWQRREWLTDFTGSYGEALVGFENAYLWTDPRYFLQAEKELDTSAFQLMKQLQGVSAPVSAWLADNAMNTTVGVDPRVMSIAQERQWSQVLSRINGVLKPISENWIDAIWENPPALVHKPIHTVDTQYTGFSATEKLALVRDAMGKVSAEILVLTQLDEIAWLFNIRGDDIPYNPLCISYAIITDQDAFLFLHKNAGLPEHIAYFSEHHITLQLYSDFEKALQALRGRVWVDPATASWWVELQLQATTLIEKTSPIVMMKAIKNKVELAGMREAHRLDAIAMVKFLHWIENHWRDGVDEISAADQLERFRREDTRCKELSFPTICGFADHGAIVHYRAEESSKHKISNQDMLLVDSGAQYFEGTTDITRTIHLGEPTQDQKKHFTLVLKGHLALRHLLFPEGACGEHINPIARMPLWNAALDFGHGTGHGVGCYLCVHEGPQRIAYGATGVALKPGMVVSNEPGLYFTGKYGIRIENLCEIVEKVSAEKSLSGNGPFYGMDDLTMVPYARNLIDKALLSEQEIAQVNTYHQRIYALLENALSPDVAMWLKAATLPL
ncbi:MAG: aminopeptidase P family protein [Coxiellaceae bacterium]|nr:aminopeptidase P family protein [Coxiellaceae bacterium]